MIYKSPIHISGFWIPIIDRNPLKTGSIGAGILLSPEVSIVGSKRSGVDRDCYVYVNNSCINIDPVDKFVEKFNYTDIYVSIDTGIPIGYGGALSAIATLSFIHTAFTYLNYLDREPDRGNETTYIRASRYAHIYEVYSLTGLGDIAAITSDASGSIVIRVEPGAPGFCITDSIDLDSNISILIAGFRKGYTTSIMLKDLMDRFRIHGSIAFKNFMANPSLDRFIEEAYRFSRGVGFLTNDLDLILQDHLRSLIRKGYIAGYFIKKRLLLVFIYDQNSYSNVLETFMRIVKSLDLVYLGIYHPTRNKFRVIDIEPHTRESSKKRITHT